MSSSILFTAALLLSIGSALPVPQTLSTTITGPGGRPIGTASMGGLDSTLTLGQGPQNNLPYNGGGNQPPCRPWLSSCWENNGNNWPNNGNNGNNWPDNGNNGNNWPNNGNNWPRNGNNNDDYEPYQPSSNAPWESGYNPTSLPDAPGGPAGTASVSTYGSGFKSRWAKSQRDVPASGWWNWFRGNGQSFGGLASGITTPAGATSQPAESTSTGQDFGGLSSGITLGGGK